MTIGKWKIVPLPCYLPPSPFWLLLSAFCPLFVLVCRGGSLANSSRFLSRLRRRLDPFGAIGRAERRGLIK